MISLERQVRIAAGSLVCLGVLLAWLVHPAFIGLSAFVGAGLIFAGVTDTCGLALLLARMPWNRPASMGLRWGDSCTVAPGVAVQLPRQHQGGNLLVNNSSDFQFSGGAFPSFGVFFRRCVLRDSVGPQVSRFPIFRSSRPSMDVIPAARFLERPLHCRPRNSDGTAISKDDAFASFTHPAFQRAAAGTAALRADGRLSAVDILPLSGSVTMSRIGRAGRGSEQGTAVCQPPPCDPI